MSPQEKLIEYLRGFGVAYKEALTSTEWYDYVNDTRFIRAPFISGMGLNLGTKTIVGSDRIKWTDILHEAAHLLATDKSPDDSNEYDLLGWEWAVTLHLGLPQNEFLAYNKEYGVYWQDPEEPSPSGFYDELGDFTLDSPAFARLMRQMTDRACALGSLNENGVPSAHPTQGFLVTELL